MGDNAKKSKGILLTSILSFVLALTSIFVLGISFIIGLLGIAAADKVLIQDFLIQYVIASILSFFSIILGFLTIVKCFRHKKSEIKHKGISFFLAIIGTIAAISILTFIIILFVAWIFY